jgi:hypothetical protein
VSRVCDTTRFLNFGHWTTFWFHMFLIRRAMQDERPVSDPLVVSQQAQQFFVPEQGVESFCRWQGAEGLCGFDCGVGANAPSPSPQGMFRVVSKALRLAPPGPGHTDTTRGSGGRSSLPGPANAVPGCVFRRSPSQWYKHSALATIWVAECTHHMPPARLPCALASGSAHHAIGYGLQVLS